MTLLEINYTHKNCWIRSGFRILKVGINECECIDFIQDKLPCRHIFAVRDHFEYSLFDINLCAVRWTNAYNLQNQPSISKSPLVSNPVPRTSSPSLEYHRIRSKEPTSKQQRFKLMKEVTDSIAQEGSMVTKDIFTQRLELLKFLDAASRQNKEVQIDQLLTLSNLSISQQTNTNTSEETDSSDIMPIALKIRGKPKDVFKSTTTKKKIKINS